MGKNSVPRLKVTRKKVMSQLGLGNAFLLLFALIVTNALAPLPVSFAEIVIDRLEEDGVWCPMAHCNRNDDSFQDLPPLRNLESIEKISDASISPIAFLSLGCSTGETMAVCAYDSPDYPALVAYDYQDGSIKWMSAIEDLPGEKHRAVNAALLVKIGLDGNPPGRHVFGANPAEFVGYMADGTRFWKRASTEISSLAPEGIGLPTSLTFSDAKELVAATDAGWIVKLNPLDGTTIDTYRMDTNVIIGGKVWRGTFITIKSPALIGNVMYLVVEFKADSSNPLPRFISPVYIVRIELSQPEVPGRENKIKPLTKPETKWDLTPDRVAIGMDRAGGSPSAWVAPDGKVLIFGNADIFVNGKRRAVISAVEDNQGELAVRWSSVFTGISGEDIVAAPALHGGSRTLLVNTTNKLYVFRDVDELVGNVPTPSPVPFKQIANCGFQTELGNIRVGAPLALTFDSDAKELVVYTNFRVVLVPFVLSYSFLVSFALPEAPGIGYPLWCSPLAFTANGRAAPGFGSAGQPALFRYEKSGTQATGLIINTISSGTYIFK